MSDASMGSIPKPITTATATPHWRSIWSACPPRACSIRCSFMSGLRLFFSIGRWAPAALFLAAGLAQAQERRSVPPQRDGGSGSSETRDDEREGPTLFERAESLSNGPARWEAEYLLAEMLERKGLPASALVKYTELLKAGDTPYREKAVDRLLGLQKKLTDEYLVPNFLSAQRAEDWPNLPEEAKSIIKDLVPGLRQRQ